MSRVLVTTMPGLGHFHPMVPLCKALRAAGHDVLVASSAPFMPVVEGAGLEGIGLGPSWTMQESERVIPGLTGGPMIDRLRAFARIAESFGDDLLAFAETWRPDVVVFDHIESAGWMVGERLGIPYVPFAMTVRVLDPWTQQFAGMVETFGALRDHFGLPPDHDLTRATRWLYLDAVPRSLTAERLPPRPSVRPIRCVADDRSGDETLPGWIDDLGDRPLVYVTMGSIFNQIDGLVATVAAGAAAVDVEVLVTVGRNHDPAALGVQAPNVHVERYVPQSLLLDRCSAIVCHGGFGAVFGSLAAGVPLVIVPIGADQPFNATFARRHGFGAVCATEPTEEEPYPLADPTALQSDEITAALTTVLADPGYREAAQRLQAEIADQPPPEHAVTLIEQLIATGQPIA